MEENKNKQDQTKTRNEQAVEQPQEKTGSDSNFYKRTMLGIGTEKIDENFDGMHRKMNELDQDDRDNNDGDANTENNY
ncbi:hypothetical protein [Adhaeribacter aquaticus]|uniref:hypothetical protein n=1 Tax=Adhaeribacter aquaticus TaxID=299567 RepID=UPI0003FAFB28|nr:hypothetical protein [Adhaeribacter aquaticus]